MRLEVSWRYFVLGAYVDRDRRTIRFYPLPFVRLSFGEVGHG
jgi:hypothetical protein